MSAMCTPPTLPPPPWIQGDPAQNPTLQDRSAIVRLPADPAPTILVVDDHPAIREWLRGVLAPHGYAVLEAASGEQALELARHHTVAVGILDILMPQAQIEGIVAARTLWFEHSIPCLMLTSVAQAATRLAAVYAGAQGYLLKETTDTRLIVEAVQAVRTGQPTPDLLVQLELTDDEKAHVYTQMAALERTLRHLTPQQQRVAQLIQAGKTNPQIATDLCVTVSTVNAHVSHILRRLGLASRHELRTRVLFDSAWIDHNP